MMTAPLDAPALLHIAMNLREWDRRELFATRWTDSPIELVDDCLAVAAKEGAICRMVGLDRPIAVIGMVPIWPGAYSAWCFGTDEFGLLAKSLTKFVKRYIIPTALAAGGHWAECRSIEGHVESHRWLTRLGFDRFGPIACGKSGENFYLFGWNLANNEGRIDVL